jgi:AcrR family transcriptional regulator
MQAALALLEKRRFAEIKMAEIAQEASLAKGTLFLYFPTKEALFLEILEDLLAEWLIDVDQQLDNGRGRWTGVRVARIITDTLVARDTLTRLFTLVSSVLEQNVVVGVRQLCDLGRRGAAGAGAARAGTARLPLRELATAAARRSAARVRARRQSVAWPATER